MLLTYLSLCDVPCADSPLQYTLEVKGGEVQWPTKEQCDDPNNVHCLQTHGVHFRQPATVWRDWLRKKIRKLPYDAKFTGNESKHSERYEQAGFNGILLDAKAYAGEKVPIQVYKHLYAVCRVSPLQ